MDENPYQTPQEIEECRRPQRSLHQRRQPWPINPWLNMLWMVPEIIWVLLVLGVLISIGEFLWSLRF